MKEEKIKIELIDRLFNTYGIKNREVTQYTLLKVKINRHKKNINITVMNLNSTDMFLGYNWLVKHSPSKLEHGKNIVYKMSKNI